MHNPRFRSAFTALATLALMLLAAPALPANDITDIGYIDQAQLSVLPSFVQANRQLQAFGANLQKQYVTRARSVPPAEQQKLSQEFQMRMATKQRELFGPLFGRAQVAIASVASSKNLSVVIDKRIMIYGGQDITGDVRDLLTGVAPPVPPVSTPPPSSVGYVDQNQIGAVPSIKTATDAFQAWKATEDRQASESLKGAKSDADRNAVLKGYQQALDDKQKELLKPVADKTQAAISVVARKRGLVLVVDRGDIIYGGTDITADVASALK